MNEVKKKEIKKTNSSSEFSENPLTIYCHLMYKFVGRNLLARKGFRSFFNKSIYNKKYENILKKANLRLMPEEYFITIYITIVFSTGLLFFLSITFLFFNSLISAGLFFGGIIGVTVLGIFLYNYPIVLAKARGKEIDAAMPYLLPYMKILAKEISLSKIIEIIDDFLIYKEMRVEFRRIKYYSNFLGYDLHNSIRESMQSCPSRELSDLMNDLVTISNSGGDIYGYLERKLSNMNQELEAIEKKNIETLLIYSQIYIVLLLISPLFFTVMTAVLSLINFSTESSSTLSATSGNFSTIIIMLLVLPLLYVGFMMLVYYSKPLYARLKPIIENV